MLIHRFSNRTNLPLAPTRSFILQRFQNSSAGLSHPTWFVPTIDGNSHANSTSSNLEAWVFVTGVRPIRLGKLDPRHWLISTKDDDLTHRIQQALVHQQLQLKEVHSRPQDGGAFMRVVSSSKTELPSLLSQLANTVTTSGIKPWWMLGSRTDVHLVKGKPWLEDMNSFPNNEILIEFDGPPLSQEILWHLIRPYGRLKQIQISNSKDPAPHVARVTLETIRSATVARNCLHGFVYQSRADKLPTTVRVSYAPRLRVYLIRSWLSSHPKIVVPILVILLGGISYTFFDPIREFFVKSHISGAFQTKRYPLFRWFQKETLGRLGFGYEFTNQIALTSNVVENERRDAAQTLRSWISRIPENLIILTGPKGSGKTQVLQSVLKDRSNTLVIDCTSLIQDGANETTIIANLAKSLGYFPQFSFLSSINNMIDLASVGLVGQKAGFSSSTEDQVCQILEIAEQALKKLSDEARTLNQHSASITPADTRLEGKTQKSFLGELWDSLKADGTPSTSLHKQSLNIPVVVLKGFHAKDSAKKDVLWSGLIEWASRLAENQVAHVIIATESTGSLKPLTKALSRQASKSIALTDASPESSLQYVSGKLSSQAKQKITIKPEHSSLIQKLGGRLTDLDALVEKIRLGMDLESAIDDIIAQSMIEIQKRCFVDGNEKEVKKLTWENEQVWDLINQLANHEEVLLHPVVMETFSGDDSILSELESTDLITILNRENGERLIKIGKPVYRSAILKLLSQKHFTAYNDLKLAQKKLSKAEQEIQTNLNQLIELAKLFPVISTVGSSGGNWLFGSSNGRLPREIRWKVDRVLEKLTELEAIADRNRKEIQRAKSLLKERVE